MTAPFSYMAFVTPAVGLRRVSAAAAVLPTAVAPAVVLGRVAAPAVVLPTAVTTAVALRRIAAAVLPITVAAAVVLRRVAATVKAEKIIEKVIEHIKILVFLWFELRK